MRHAADAVGDLELKYRFKRSSVALLDHTGLSSRYSATGIHIDFASPSIPPRTRRQARFGGYSARGARVERARLQFSQVLAVATEARASESLDARSIRRTPSQYAQTKRTRRPRKSHYRFPRNPRPRSR